MKLLLTLGLLGLSLNSFAKVDYSHCSNTFTNYSNYGDRDFPFKITEDGKIKHHSSVNYNEDKKNNTEVITYGDEKFGNSNKIVITRDKSGELKKIVQTNSLKSIKTKTGMGSSAPLGFRVGLGGGGWQGGGMMGPVSDSKIISTHDIKVQNNKCVAYRAHGESQTGSNTHSQMIYDVKLCRDVKVFLKKNPSINNCFSDAVSGKIDALLDSHKNRNKDLYDISKDTKENFSGGLGGMGGPFMPTAMSIDQIVNAKKSAGFGPKQPRIVDLMKISQRCNFTNSPLKKMTDDEELWEQQVLRETLEGADKTIQQ